MSYTYYGTKQFDPATHKLSYLPNGKQFWDNWDVEMRFMKKVYKDRGSGCWLWRGAKSKGYGIFMVQTPHGKLMIGAHVYACVRFNLPITDFNKPHTLHSCDNKICVNPEHLRFGTPQENSVDYHTRGKFKPPFEEKYVSLFSV